MVGRPFYDDLPLPEEDQAPFARFIELRDSAFASQGKPLDGSRVMALVREAGVDLDKLLADGRTSAKDGQSLDWDLVEGILVGMDRWASEHGLNMTPEKQSMVLRLLYRKYTAKENPPIPLEAAMGLGTCAGAHKLCAPPLLTPNHQRLILLSGLAILAIFPCAQ